jgi:hypothetical protein
MKEFYTFDQKIAYNQAKEDLNKVLKTKYHELKLRLRDEKYIDKEHFSYLNGQMDLIRELCG